MKSAEPSFHRDSKPSRLKSDYFLSKILRGAIARRVEDWKPKEIGRIVDFGCGYMPYRALLTPCCQEYIGCDLVGTGAMVEFEPGGVLPIDRGSVDRVVSFQVLEHVHDISWYLGEIHNMLKPDGSILLSTHGVWPYHPHPEDFWRWTRSGLILVLERHGFKVQSVDSLAGPGAWTLMLQFGALSLGLSKLGFPGTVLAAGVNFLLSLVLPLVDRLTPSDFKKNNSSVYLVSATKKNE